MKKFQNYEQFITSKYNTYDDMSFGSTELNENGVKITKTIDNILYNETWNVSKGDKNTRFIVPISNIGRKEANILLKKIIDGYNADEFWNGGVGDIKPNMSIVDENYFIPTPEKIENINVFNNIPQTMIHESTQKSKNYIKHIIEEIPKVKEEKKSIFKKLFK